MVAQTLSLKDFRNYESLRLEFGEGVNILRGDNAQGKTNCLEALYLCATGRSRRVGADREMIRFGCREAHVQAMVRSAGHGLGLDKIDVHLKKDEKKGVAVNGIPIKKLGDLFGAFLVVMFSPEDLQLVKAGPAQRRQFMDMELCQLSHVYYYDLQQYYRSLKQRNNLLKSIHKKPELKETLFAWDVHLVDFGMRIMAQRAAFVSGISLSAGRIHQSITNRAEQLEILYRPNTAKEDFADRLSRNIDRDIFTGSTSVGIHKDDFLFQINGCDARAYGSQGQQRTASLSAKLAEIELIRTEKDENPVLLLDDVLSELDRSRQRHLFETVQSVQSVITCTGMEDALRNLPGATVFQVKSGVLSALKF